MYIARLCSIVPKAISSAQKSPNAPKARKGWAENTLLVLKRQYRGANFLGLVSPKRVPRGSRKLIPECRAKEEVHSLAPYGPRTKRGNVDAAGVTAKSPTNPRARAERKRKWPQGAPRAGNFERTGNGAERLPAARPEVPGSVRYGDQEAGAVRRGVLALREGAGPGAALGSFPRTGSRTW